MTDVEELKAELAAGRARLLGAIAGVTEEQFKRRPALRQAQGERNEEDDSWCIAEVLAHLLANERLWTERLKLALREDGAVVIPSEPGVHEANVRAGRQAPVPQLIHGLLAERREMERLIDAAAKIEQGFERHVQHPQRGRFTIERIVRETAIAHEAEHAAQIEALRAAVGAKPVEAA